MAAVTTSHFAAESIDLDGKTILVTGGTGSFGRHFVRTVAQRFKPKKLIVFSRDELKQYEMEQEFGRADYPFIRFFIGDIREEKRLNMAMRGVDIVVHAAALKHVTAAEYNPFECIQTNVIGTENLVQAAINNGVKKVIALSTDKAANPVNLYGASKLAADKIVVAANNLSGDLPTRLAVVRYGNVVGSRGSVVPLFQRLVAQGVSELPITDPDMTRFWITLQEGVDFVLSSLNMMTGGEIFVPKIASMRMVDLADALAPGTPYKVVGIRPGEKLHETMITVDDARSTFDLGDRYVIAPQFELPADCCQVAKKGKPVPKGFHYASDSNDIWLDAAGLMRMLGSGERR